MGLIHRLPLSDILEKMRKPNIWAFTVVFIAMVISLAWNRFKLPAFFVDETIECMAVVVNREIIGKYLKKDKQKITFIYPSKGIWYLNTVIISLEYGDQFVGAQLIVECDQDDPSEFEIQKFLGNLQRSGNYEKNLTYTGTDGYIEIKIRNEIMDKTTFGDSGVIIEKRTGPVSLVLGADSLLFLPKLLTGKKYDKPVLVADSMNTMYMEKYLFVLGSSQNSFSLIDVATGFKYEEQE